MIRPRSLFDKRKRFLASVHSEQRTSSHIPEIRKPCLQYPAKMRPIYSSLRSNLRIPTSSTSTLIGRRSFSARASLSLWNGTTQPYENQKIPSPPAPQQAAAPPSNETLSEAEKIENIHKRFVEDLLNRAAASAHGLDAHSTTSNTPSKPRRQQRTRQHSLSEPALFRTDGPLTPYPIELDSGELLEPKHATLVRITDRNGEERRIVVAEVEEESGKQRRVLLAVDLNEYQQSGGNGGAVGRKISAEEMYATLGLETQGVKP